jgi:hypothetical protein
MASKKDLLEKAKALGLSVSSWWTKADLQEAIDDHVIEAESRVDTEIEGEVQTEVVQVKQSDLVTFLGSGPLSGEYRFAEIEGSIAAKTVEEAIQKAEDIAINHPNLLKK